MSADKQFYDRWWEGLCSEDANRRELAQLSALVASINKSILLRSTEPLNNPSTRDMAGHAHAQCNAAQRNATLALESKTAAPEDAAAAIWLSVSLRRPCGGERRKSLGGRCREERGWPALACW